MGSNHMNDHLRKVSTENDKPIESSIPETDMDKLNRFLITVANTDGVGIRRKILIIKKFLEVLGDKT
jgi:hypothetical protein